MRRGGTSLAIGSLALLAGAGAVLRHRRGSGSRQPQEDAWDALLDLGTIYVSEHAPDALVRDLVELEADEDSRLPPSAWKRSLETLGSVKYRGSILPGMISIHGV